MPLLIPPDELSVGASSTPINDPGRGEHEALALLGGLLPPAPPGEIWFGDDAAVLRPAPAGMLLLLASDTVVVGVDADLSLTTLADLGWKAMAVNLSDLAAMGGKPAHAVVSVVGAGPADLRQLYAGILEAATRYSCPVVGGDLSAGQQVVVTVAVTGSVDGAPVLRSGAQPGDSIWVSGRLGAAAAGLRLLRAGADARGWSEPEQALVRAHARPRPALAEGTEARRAGATAMIDVSDGLLDDLGRIAEGSGVGFDLRQVPVAPGATLEEALAGGEDYVVVFTLPAGLDPAPSFEAAGLGAPYRIGTCLADRAQRLVDGQTFSLRGWEHVL